MLLNNNDELLQARKGKGRISICMAQRSKHTGDWYKIRRYRDLL